MHTSVRCRSVVGAAAVIALFAFSPSTVHAQSDPLKCWAHGSIPAASTILRGRNCNGCGPLCVWGKS